MLKRLTALMFIAGLAAAPAPAALLYQTTVTSDGTTADLFGELADVAVLTTGSTFVTVSTGALSYADWSLNGELAKSWWEDIGPDQNGDPIPHLTGNEYFYLPGCQSSLAAPACGSRPLRTRLGNNILRIDFLAPKSYDRCFPFPGFNFDCAEYYTIYLAQFYLSTASSSDVTYSFYDAAPNGAVPEPAGWALMIAGFGLIGTVARRRRRTSVAA